MITIEIKIIRNFILLLSIQNSTINNVLINISCLIEYIYISDREQFEAKWNLNYIKHLFYIKSGYLRYLALGSQIEHTLF